MKSIRAILTGLLAALSMQPMLAHSEDIDIYSGLSSANYTPNVLILLDNSASLDANAATCNYADGSGSPSGTGIAGKLFGMEMCSLFNVIYSLPTNPDGSARVNIGFMYYNANGIAGYGNGNNNCQASSNSGGCLAKPLTPMTAANKTAFMNWIKSWTASAIKTNSESTASLMDEAWAYYSGGQGPSGLSYAGVAPSPSCAKNFVIFIGNAANTVSSPGDGGGATPHERLLSKYPSGTYPGDITILSGSYGLPGPPASYCSTGGSTYTMGTHNNSSGLYADEWARYMYQTDLYVDTVHNPPTDYIGKQSVTTYAVGVVGPTGCKPDYPALLTSMALYGGGKYYPTDVNNSNDLVQSILKILNEVQAVNSVFSSSSLPVSVNAQGTYLNQIYMGMFRPDSAGQPRWAGNLKQYEFIIDANGNLQLGDSVGQVALSAAGTGFLSSNAISFWTCSNSSNPNLTTAQQATMSGQGQICASDPASGFWVNSSIMANTAGKAFDAPDGEMVEKGGAAQRIRLDNLTDDYAANPSTPRKLYTYCPSGASCNADLTNAVNAFATTNTGITASMFGSTITANISSIVRNAAGTSGTTATVTTSGNHGFNSGDIITIANASPTDYNGSYSISVVDATHFTYPVVEYPVTPATGSYTSQKAGVPVNVTLSRSGNTVTATAAAAHGFLNGTTVIISNASPSDYNGSFVITTSGPTSTTFTYTIKEQPPTTGQGGTATSVYKTSGSGCPCSNTVSITSVTRSLGSTTVTVQTGSTLTTGSTSWSVGSKVTLSGVLDSSNIPETAYNGQFTITSFPTSTSFTFTTTLSPSTPATTATGFASITASLSTSPVAITSLTRTDIAGTATATAAATTAAAHGYAIGDTVSIGSAGTAPSTESAYLGNFVITAVPTATTFQYTISTTPVTPATALPSTIMTATRSTGFVASDMNKLINWMRGEDNYGDESGPGGGVTVRPSLHGDVLHSRPAVINYGGSIINITATSDSGSTRTATASTADVAKIGGTGTTANIKFSTGNICTATVASSTTFTYRTTSCGDSGAQSVVTDTANVVVFYGDNGGVFHAVNGNQTNPLGSTLPAPGSELWGFIPKEHFIKLNRLRSNSPQLNLASTPPGISPTPLTKDYFIDGPTGVYQLVDTKGTTLTAYLYLSMRRGGRMIYALDVTNPQSPRHLWKVDNTTANMGELGQTWSNPKVARIQGYSNPVLIFAAGYDPNEDNDPPTAADSMGRGIFVLDALTGALVWKATYDGAASGSNNTTYTSTSSGSFAVCGSDRLKYSIASDITLMDRDSDGYIDRLYVADTGGQVWRVDLEPGGNATPSNWKLHRLATLGECGTTVCRKFFYPPEVINTAGYDAVIVGSGDREHPLFNNTAAAGKQNIVFLLKDTYTGNDATGMTRISLANGDLFNATSTAYDGSLRGYYIGLADGEKVVNAPLVTAGYVYFGTNQPTPPSSVSCTATLGIARGYRLSPFTGSYQSVVFAGGGLPPSPVSGIVNINIGGQTKQVPFLIGGGNPDCTGADCASALGGQKPPINVSTSRIRTYWYRQGK